MVALHKVDFIINRNYNRHHINYYIDKIADKITFHSAIIEYI